MSRNEVLLVASLCRPRGTNRADIARAEILFYCSSHLLFFDKPDCEFQLRWRSTSCDVPFLNLALIAYLIGKIADNDIVVPYCQDRFQPLHAIDRCEVTSYLNQQLERGELRPVFLYGKVRTCKLKEDELRCFDPDVLSFFNMNTPEDYQNALALWQALTR